MLISVIVSLVSMLSPNGENGAIGKNLKLICGLCVALVSVYPIIEIVEDVKSLDIGALVDNGGQKEEYQDRFDLSYEAAELENLRSGIRGMLSDRFGIDTSECDVSVTVRKNADGQNELERIFITLYGRAIFKNTAEIERSFGEIFDCEIVTAIG